MSHFRPEAIALLMRFREPALSGVALAFGLWVATRGGVFLAALGGAIALLSAASLVLALRRMRFAGAGDAPGVVEVIEGQVSYFGPVVGGAVGLPDLVELRLISMRGRRLWRLKQADGQVLLVPVDARGAEALFDAFAALPGLTSADLVQALQPLPAAGQGLPALAENRLVWSRRARGQMMRAD